MSSPTLPVKIDTALSELFDRGERLGRSKYVSQDEKNHAVAEAKSALLEAFREAVLENAPADRPNTHQLGDFTPDQVGDIEKAAIAALYEAQGFNQANKEWRHRLNQILGESNG